MIYRSKAPLRIGLAGGGTDVSPYSDLFGGAILNATISLYAHASIEILPEPVVNFISYNSHQREEFPLAKALPMTGELDLHKAIFNGVQMRFGRIEKGFRLSTFVDAPVGSGLGSSSTLAVAILGAFAEMLQLPFGEYDLAHAAFEIERYDLNWAGGKQDQYAATFGGVNFMEFYDNDKVIVNPLRLKQQCLLELENNLVLYSTATSRNSSDIIAQQALNVRRNNFQSVDAMHQLKQQAQFMKEALLKGSLENFGDILHFGHQQKQKMAEGISNPLIEEMYQTARTAGATGGKISGAGGGGFLVFYCPGSTRYRVTEQLQKIGGRSQAFQFVGHGLKTWSHSYGKN